MVLVDELDDDLVDEVDEGEAVQIDDLYGYVLVFGILLELLLQQAEHDEHDELDILFRHVEVEVADLDEHEV